MRPLPGSIPLLQALCLGAAVALGSPAPASAAPPDRPDHERLFVQGQELEAREDYEGACKVYLEVARLYPKSESAPSALFQCAHIRDEKQDDVDPALDLYGRVWHDYPNSGSSLRAELRGQAIAPFAGKWAASYKEFQALVRNRAFMKDLDYEAKMDALLEKHPGFPGSAGMRLYLAKAAAKREEYDRARHQFLKIAEESPHSPSAAFAYKGLGDIEYAQDHYALALAYYDAAIQMAEELDIEMPAPRQRLRTYRYVIRREVFLGSLVVTALCLMGLVWISPGRPDWKESARFWLKNSLLVLPVFAGMYGLSIYLLKVTAEENHEELEHGIPLTGHETLFIGAAFALTSLALLVGHLLWQGVREHPRKRLIFWTCFPLFLLAVNYCVFYGFDLVFYLESAFFGINPSSMEAPK